MKNDTSAKKLLIRSEKLRIRIKHFSSSPVRLLVHLQCQSLNKYSTQSGNTGPGKLLHLFHPGAATELPSRLFTPLLQEMDGTQLLFKYPNTLGKNNILSTKKYIFKLM